MNLNFPFEIKDIHRIDETWEIVRIQGATGSPETFGKWTIVAVWVKCKNRKYGGISRYDKNERIEKLAIHNATGETVLLLPSTVDRGRPYVRWTEKRIDAYANGIHEDYQLMEICGKAE